MIKSLHLKVLPRWTKIGEERREMMPEPKFSTLAKSVWIVDCHFLQNLPKQRSSVPTVWRFNHFSNHSHITWNSSITLWKLTVWKFSNYSTSHILREINFCESRVSKYAILTFSAPLKFSFCEFLHLSNLILLKIKSQSL